jgi:hypothetical protein
MVYTFIKTDNTAASVHILNIITVRSLQLISINLTQNSPSWEANSCSAPHSIPYLLHNTYVHYNFTHTLTHNLSPNFFNPPTFCSHIHSSLNNITIKPRMFSTHQTPFWHTKMGGGIKHWQITQKLTKCTDLKQEHTSDEDPTSNLTNPIPKHIH